MLLRREDRMFNRTNLYLLTCLMDTYCPEWMEYVYMYLQQWLVSLYPIMSGKL